MWRIPIFGMKNKEKKRLETERYREICTLHF